jgi:hypothetical protein
MFKKAYILYTLGELREIRALEISLIQRLLKVQTGRGDSIGYEPGVNDPGRRAWPLPSSEGWMFCKAS